MQIKNYPTITTISDNDLLLVQTASDGAYKSVNASAIKGSIGGNAEYFGGLEFLAHFNGDDNSTAITEVKGNPISLYGNAKIRTINSKFGDGSLFLDGSGSYLSFPYSNNIDICNGDFRLECWYFPLTVTGFRPIVCQWKQTSGTGGFVLGTSGTAIIFSFGAYSEGSDLLNGGNLSLNNWHHIAVTRVGPNFTLWLDGAVVATASNNLTRSLPSLNFSVGNYYNSNGSIGAAGASDCNAYINELRITKPAPYSLAVPIAAFNNS